MKYGVLIEETLRKSWKMSSRRLKWHKIGQKGVSEFSMLYITHIQNMFKNLLQYGKCKMGAFFLNRLLAKRQKPAFFSVTSSDL